MQRRPVVICQEHHALRLTIQEQLHFVAAANRLPVRCVCHVVAVTFALKVNPAWRAFAAQ
jgi:predicted DNA-binding protein (UPF0251 family)